MNKRVLWVVERRGPKSGWRVYSSWRTRQRAREDMKYARGFRIVMQYRIVRYIAEE